MTLVFRSSSSRTLRIGVAVVLILAAAASAVVGSGKASAATLAVDAQVTTHQSSRAASITSPTFSTHAANEVLIAFLTSDGPNKAAGESFSSVTGGGLTWSLRARANGQPGTAEIWQAVAPQILTNVSVTAMRASGSYGGAITVVAFSGADTSRTGATSSGNAGTGAPGVSLTTTVGGSWVWGVGNDWSTATARTPGSNQTVVDQYLAPAGDTYWVQSQNAVTANTGTAVTINDTAPTSDMWDLAAIEVVPQGSTGTTPPTAPTNLTASVVSNAEVDLSWMASTSSIGVAGYTVTRNGIAIGTSPNPTFNDTTVSASTTYTYTVTAFDTQGNVSGPSNGVTVTTPAAGLDQTGQWGSLINWPVVAVHGAMLPDGKIMTWGDASTGDTAVVWDPATNTFTSVPDAFANPMCGGLNALPDGRVITVGGGGLNPPGVTTVTGFNETNSSWAQLASTSPQTWYASTAVLPNGNLIRIGGVKGCNSCNPEVPEEYSPATNQWTTLSNNPTLLPMYPFTYVRPDGTVAVTGASEVTSALRIYDPATQAWTTSDPNVVDGGSSAMYDTGKVIKAGSATDNGGSGSSAATAYTTDLGQATPTWTQTGSMTYPRSFLNLTPLPDGTVLATGGETTKDGTNLNNGVLPAEDWNPATGKWTTWASMAIPRLYHSVGMLMPDGRVFVAGTGDESGQGVPNEFSAQIFSPPYLFKGPRPTIASSPSVVQYGSSFQVSTPDASSITSVSLIRTAAVTHSFDQSTRRVSLPFTASNGTLNVQAPVNGAAAPPGNYMLFIVNSSGVPSVASWVHLPAPYEDNVAPSAPTGLTATAAGSSSVNLSWTASTDNVGVTGYNILRNGTKVGTSTTNSYTDNGLASNTPYTYTVTAFDAAGNVSQPSNSVNVTTPAVTTPPVISNVSVSPAQTSATVTWTTDTSSSSQVAYGTTTAYGSTTPLDPTLVTAHSQTISGLTPGQLYHFSVTSADGSGNSSTSPDSTFTTLANAPLAIDAQVSTHTTSAATTITSPSFSTKQPNELLEAFIATDGPGSATQTIASVTGGGLTWTLRSRANNRPGTAEIWQAVAPAALNSATVTATLSRGSYVGAMTVVSFTGANTSVNGATASAGAASGAPTLSLTTTRGNSWVFAVGNDWDKAIARTVGANQTVVDQDLAPVGDTYWLQRQNATTPNSGTSVTMNDTAPTSDQWNLALIEIPTS
jgi:fibronectin type 3 domain-containing protein